MLLALQRRFFVYETVMLEDVIAFWPMQIYFISCLAYVAFIIIMAIYMTY